MKRFIAVALIASLSANALLIACWAMRRQPGQFGTSDATDVREKNQLTATSSNSKNKRQAELGAAADAKARPSIWDRLASNDPATFEANLRAAGFSLGARRGAVYALLRDLQTPRRQKIFEAWPAEPYWKTGGDRAALAAYAKEVNQMWLERDRTMREVFPEERLAFTLRMQQRYGPLPEEKLEQLVALDTDYSEMRRQILMQNSAGIRMPWHGEQLAYLDQEKRNDLATILGPQELEAYDLRASPTAIALKRQLSSFDVSEEEYRTLFQLRAAFDEKFPPLTVGPVLNGAERLQATSELDQKIKAAFGETRYADYTRATDRGFQAAYQVAQQLKLPAENATAVYELQNDLSRREMAIRADRNQTPAQQAEQLATLGQEAQEKLSALLTPAGREQYMRQASGVWARLATPPKKTAP